MDYVQRLLMGLGLAIITPMLMLCVSAAIEEFIQRGKMR